MVSVYTGLNGQETARVYGRVADENGRPMELVNVAISGLPGGTTTDAKGRYELNVPAGRKVLVVFSFVGYEKQVYEVELQTGASFQIDRILKSSSTALPQIEIADEEVRKSNLLRINPKVAVNIPTSSERIPTLLKTLPGVSSSNELSSQYSVRGGNFDENLVYVNDIEIYRPFLIRSGQQEGLSFVNSDLVSSLLFSAGGFDAKYGDKMSSVLDLQYRTPNEFGGSFSGSLLGGSLHLEGVAAKRKVTWLTGIRYKSNQYLLNSLETSGDYKPSFMDVQGLVTWQAAPRLSFSLLGNIARNKYQLIPESRETDFGTVQQARRLTIYFEGQEVDRYLTWVGGFTTTYRPDKDTRLRLIISGYQSEESETYDLLGQYWIGLIENDLSSENFGEVVESQGVGSFLEHARNRLNLNVFNVAHKGTKEVGQHLFDWGIKWQQEEIHDKTSEWTLIDSAGYTLPRPPDSVGYTHPELQPDYPLVLQERIKTTADLFSNRLTAFIQDRWDGPEEDSPFALTAGVRFSWWDMNKQLLVSPRATLAYTPDWEKDVLFRFSAGVYYQPPFYRELKDLDGTLNTNQKAQVSYHFVAASDLKFKAWGRPFSFVTEAYFKYLDNLVPYLLDNVRIRYYAFEQSIGYTAGIDFNISGEFVPGVDSWASLSFLTTQEDILGDQYTGAAPGDPEPGYIPRPTDQRVNFSVFFQDYLPMNPTYKMSLTMTFGSSLPFGAPGSPKYQHTLRMPPYRRVDIGFSKEIIGTHTRFSPSSPFRFFKTLWITAEVLNLLQVNNTVSYIWVSDVYGRQYAVPNYLTPRQLNVKLAASF
ncbi:MAG: carboxypeptidase-like regulatory domain-containing protein [Bacteroidales bacterium]